jgi:pyrimidine operon attenuation protein/uracil phosphoribosyltransferase
MKTQVLDSKQISKMIKRMAYQIYESNFSEKELILVGIAGQGYELAKLIQSELEEILQYQNAINPTRIKQIETRGKRNYIETRQY